MYLFGSRAREDWRPDSDFDILVIVPERKQALVDQLYDAVLDVQLETGSLISLKIFTEGQYDRLGAIPTPFLANVKAEGVRLGFDD
jgi:predicted nucleotidyltransferase